MATIDNQFGKGIGVAAGFDLGAQKPLDSRIAVNTIEERDAHVTNNRAYEGMHVYVAETKRNYQLKDVNGELTWVDMEDELQDQLDEIKEALGLEGEGSTSGDSLLDRVGTAEADIDALEALVGKAAVAGEGEEAGTPATGLHLALDEEKAAREAAEQGLQGEIDALEQLVGTKDDAKEAETVYGAIAAEKAARETAVQGVQDDLDTFKGTQATKDGEQDQALADEVARATGEEGKIRTEFAAADSALKSELQAAIEAVQKDVDQNEADCDTAIAGEKERALAAEGVLDAAIKAEASRAEAAEKANAAAVATEKSRAEAAEGALSDRLAALEGGENSVASQIQAAVDDINEELEAMEEAQATKDGEQDKALAAEVTRAKGEEARIEGLVTAEAEAARAAEKTLTDNLTAEVTRATGVEAGLQAAINVLNGDDKTEGSVAKDIADAIALVNGAADTLAGRVTVNEGHLATIMGNAETAGSIAKAEADAKAYADQKIADLVDSAPDAMNTLNELAKAIKDNEDVYKAYVEEHATAMAQQKADLQKEIDDDVKVETERALAAEAGLDAAIKAEAARADAAEKVNAAAVATEKSRAEGVEAGLQDAIDAINTQLSGAQAEKDAEQDEAIQANTAALATEIARAEGEEEKIRQELADEAEEIRGEMAAELGNYTVKTDEGVVSKEASGLRKEIEELQNSVVETITELNVAYDAEKSKLTLSVVDKDGDGDTGVAAVISEADIPVMTDDEVTALLDKLDEVLDTTQE